MTQPTLTPRPAALLLCALTFAVSACSSVPRASVGTTPATVPPAGQARPPVREPVRNVGRDPTIHMMPGLEGVIGATESQLTRQFGAARLEVWEGDARKLQFTGSPCILDVYLYPTSRSAEPIASYVDARRGSDGQDVDRAACVAALRKR